VGGDASGEAAGQALDLAQAELRGVDDDAALAAPEGHAHDRALPGHPHRQRLGLVEVRKTGSVVGFPGSRDISNAELLELDADILIPAAMENQITAANAGRIGARLIAEGANGPTTPEADEILYANGRFLIPDILCNAGGVTVSYFEWVQNLDRDLWSIEHVNDKLHEIMTRAFADTLATSLREQVNMRTAAYLLAVQRVADATSARGLYP